MLLIEWLAILAFFVLLLLAIFLTICIYACDNLNCKAFDEADEIAPRGTKEYAIALLGELYNDGVWPLPYIGAAILTPLVLWFMGVCIVVKDFAIIFLTSFIVIYFLFSFFGHHYVKFISNYVAGYIQDNCPSTPPPEDTNIDNDTNIIENEGITIGEARISRYDSNTGELVDDNGLGITFAPPVNTL